MKAEDVAGASQEASQLDITAISAKCALCCAADWHCLCQKSWCSRSMHALQAAHDVAVASSSVASKTGGW